MQKIYKTVLNEAVAEFEEKKSKFIASVKPVTSDEQAVEFINSLKSKYWNATHNVYAYYIQGDTVIQRFSDDGEPSGTAGMPVLEVIKRMGVQDVVVVVTRYFGGTLLGAAGLIRAYGKAASLGIDAARVIKRQLCTAVRIIVEYTLFGKVQNLILSEGYPVKDTVYEQDVEITVFVAEDDVDRFMNTVTEATNARCIMELAGKSYITIDEEGRRIEG
jgi:uncharacterized YigZ family protein